MEFLWKIRKAKKWVGNKNEIYDAFESAAIENRVSAKCM